MCGSVAWPGRALWADGFREVLSSQGPGEALALRHASALTHCRDLARCPGQPAG